MILTNTIYCKKPRPQESGISSEVSENKYI